MSKKDEEAVSTSVEFAEKDTTQGLPNLALESTSSDQDLKSLPSRKWSLGVLEDYEAEEVPGTIVLLHSASETDDSSNPGVKAAAKSQTTVGSGSNSRSRSRPRLGRRVSSRPKPKKRTKDGKIILEPQPDESLNDPLNWAVWRRDIALLSIGFLCMIGGGMTTVLAAGFPEVAATYDIPLARVALTTGLFLLGLGLGSVVNSPTAILFGKRPVYLAGCFVFVLSAIWCALSPTFISLILARILMGFAVSPVECLPSASISEIYFLHERAYRLGVYTLLLLGGKNLVPLAAAGIVQSLSWRWVFWVVAIIVGLCWFLLFFFVPETFWDRTPQRPKTRGRRSFARIRRLASFTSSMSFSHSRHRSATPGVAVLEKKENHDTEVHLRYPTATLQVGETSGHNRRAHFVSSDANGKTSGIDPSLEENVSFDSRHVEGGSELEASSRLPHSGPEQPGHHSEAWKVVPNGQGPVTPQLHTFNSAWYASKASDSTSKSKEHAPDLEKQLAKEDKALPVIADADKAVNPGLYYTRYYQAREAKSYVETLKPYHGRLSNKNWFRVAARPFILFLYPGIAWSAMVYALSVGWLIVLSESIATIYDDPTRYDFDAISIGLVYLSPFIGGLLGTVIAGKCSDYLVRFICSFNNGVYEPEFRLFMIIPSAIATTAGLMGFGWSAQLEDSYWVPTIFFGVISFGCTCGSTTAIAYAIDCYRQYAGEALVTINFSKNIFHGLVFSLFFDSWLDSDGPKTVFVTIGGIQLFFLLSTIPMYIFGKRARMWTSRKNLMRWIDKPNNGNATQRGADNK